MGAGSREAFCLKKPDPSSGGSQDPKDHEKDEDADQALAFSLLLASGYVCTAAGIVVFKLHWITSNRIFKPFSAGRAFYPSGSLFPDIITCPPDMVPSGECKRLDFRGERENQMRDVIMSVSQTL